MLKIQELKKFYLDNVDKFGAFGDRYLVIAKKGELNKKLFDLLSESGFWEWCEREASDQKIVYCHWIAGWLRLGYKWFAKGVMKGSNEFHHYSGVRKDNRLENLTLLPKLVHDYVTKAQMGNIKRLQYLHSSKVIGELPELTEIVNSEGKVISSQEGMLAAICYVVEKTLVDSLVASKEWSWGKAEEVANEFKGFGKQIKLGIVRVSKSADHYIRSLNGKVIEQFNKTVVYLRTQVWEEGEEGEINEAPLVVTNKDKVIALVNKISETWDKRVKRSLQAQLRKLHEQMRMEDYLVNLVF